MSLAPKQPAMDLDHAVDALRVTRCAPGLPGLAAQEGMYAAIAIGRQIGKERADVGDQFGHVEPLGDILANDVEHATTVGAGFALHIDDLLDAFQMGRKPAAVGVLRAGCPGLVAGRVKPGTQTAHRRVESLVCERQLVGIELLGPCAEPVPLERGDDRGQPLDLRPGVGVRAFQIGDERLLLGDLSARWDQHRAKQRGVVGKVGLDQHGESEPAGMHPVNRPVAERSNGGRHAPVVKSKPSISAPKCATVRRMTPS